MLRLLLFLLLLLASWLGLFPSIGNPPEPNPNSVEALREAFTNPECANPCWLGIEVGVTTRAEAMAILREHHIPFDKYGVLHIHEISNDLVPGIDPDGNPSPYGNAYGDINVGMDNESIVISIDFHLDVCISTVIEAFGAPKAWLIGRGVPTLLVYSDYGLFFDLDYETHRVEVIVLHQPENMPPVDELEDWSLYADMFSDDCSDVFTQ